MRHGHILKHLRAIRQELDDPITPRRKLDAVYARIRDRLEKIETAVRESNAKASNTSNGTET